MATPREKARVYEARYRERHRAAMNARVYARRKAHGRNDYDPDKHRAYCKANADHRREVKRQWRARNADRVRATKEAWRQQNMARCAEYQAQRRGRWRSHPAVTVFYEIAARVTRCTGIPHEVDHVIPLRGRTVSGLHVPWNMRVTPKQVNRIKSNTVPA